MQRVLTVPVCAVRVKSSAAELVEGESAILTLADAEILDDDGNVAEEQGVLEETSKAQQAERRRRQRCGAHNLVVNMTLVGMRCPSLIGAAMQDGTEAGAALRGR